MDLFDMEDSPSVLCARNMIHVHMPKPYSFGIIGTLNTIRAMIEYLWSATFPKLNLNFSPHQVFLRVQRAKARNMATIGMHFFGLPYNFDFITSCGGIFKLCHSPGIQRFALQPLNRDR
jgi:hypothetical protein